MHSTIGHKGRSSNRWHLKHPTLEIWDCCMKYPWVAMCKQNGQTNNKCVWLQFLLHTKFEGVNARRKHELRMSHHSHTATFLMVQHPTRTFWWMDIRAEKSGPRFIHKIQGFLITFKKKCLRLLCRRRSRRLRHLAIEYMRIFIVGKMFVVNWWRWY